MTELERWHCKKHNRSSYRAEKYQTSVTTKMLGFVTGLVPLTRNDSVVDSSLKRCRVRTSKVSLRMQLKRLRWSEFEDRAAYAPLPRNWAGEFDSIGPLDPPKSQEEKLPEQIFGQKYEKPLPLNITPEEEAAFKAFQSAEQRARQEAVARLAEKKQLETAAPGIMSNFDPAWVYKTPVLEYWRSRK
jgi:hypothetical protein